MNSDTVFFQYFVNENMNYARQIFCFDGSLKSWELLKCSWREIKIQMDTNCTFSTKIIWKEILKKENGNSNNRIMKDHHLIKKYQVHSLSKLESKINLIRKYQIQSLSKLESK